MAGTEIVFVFVHVFIIVNISESHTDISNHIYVLLGIQSGWQICKEAIAHVHKPFRDFKYKPDYSTVTCSVGIL